MAEYKVAYRDGRTQQVTADTHGVYGDWIVFSRNRKDVLRIAAKEVERVAEAGVADPVSPAPVVA